MYIKPSTQNTKNWKSFYHTFNMTIDQPTLKNLFFYKEGNLFWKNNVTNRVSAGSIAGYVRSPQNYRYIGIKGSYYSAHRLIFLYHYGFLPKNIDHIDGNVYNNCIENLRECTLSQNLFNTKKTSKNTSGFKGISWYDSNNKWCAKVSALGKTHRKFFNNIEDANKWAISMRENLHGEFCKH